MGAWCGTHDHPMTYTTDDGGYWYCSITGKPKLMVDVRKRFVNGDGDFIDIVHYENGSAAIELAGASIFFSGRMAVQIAEALVNNPRIVSVPPRHRDGYSDTDRDRPDPNDNTFDPKDDARD